MAIVLNPRTGYLTCDVHGGKLSSDCGTYDAPCGPCEAEMDDEREAAEWEAMPDAERAEIEAELAVWTAQALAYGTWVPEADDILF
jgi:hypothetical protein